MPPHKSQSQKYIKLSNDNISTFVHSPNKTLLYIIKTINTNYNELKYLTRAEWISHMKSNLAISVSKNTLNFGDNIICNDYEKFIEKVVHAFLSL